MQPFFGGTGYVSCIGYHGDLIKLERKLKSLGTQQTLLIHKSYLLAHSSGVKNSEA